MALDSQKFRAFAPLLLDEEYRRRRRLLVIAGGALLAAIGLIVVIAFGAFTQQSEQARMLIAFVLLCWAALSGFASFGLFTLWYGQWAARRAHAYVDELDGRAS